jgi:hypothetical protein
MNRENQHFLKEVFYRYWMDRVPQLDEFEAIDHLEWEIRIAPLKNGRRNTETVKRLRKFLKEKKVKFEVGK